MNKVLNIKFEVDVTAPTNFETEVKVLTPPITASVRTLKMSSLFADKMHPVLFREWKTRIKGRDFYDLLEKRINSIDWRNAKKDVVNFLQDPAEVDFWSEDLFLAAIKSLKVV